MPCCFWLQQAFKGRRRSCASSGQKVVESLHRCARDPPQNVVWALRHASVASYQLKHGPSIPVSTAKSKSNAAHVVPQPEVPEPEPLMPAIRPACLQDELELVRNAGSTPSTVASDGFSRLDFSSDGSSTIPAITATGFQLPPKISEASPLSSAPKQSSSGLSPLRHWPKPLPFPEQLRIELCTWVWHCQCPLVCSWICIFGCACGSTSLNVPASP